MSILARQREKDPQAGYAEDFLDILRSLTPALKAQPQLKIVANSGGMNPPACARAAAKALAEAGLGETTIGVVTGDDLLPRMNDLLNSGCEFQNLDTGQPLSILQDPAGGASSGTLAPIVSANAYLALARLPTPWPAARGSSSRAAWPMHR